MRHPHKNDDLFVNVESSSAALLYWTYQHAATHICIRPMWKSYGHKRSCSEFGCCYTWRWHFCYASQLFFRVTFSANSAKHLSRRFLNSANIGVYGWKARRQSDGTSVVRVGTPRPGNGTRPSAGHCSSLQRSEGLHWSKIHSVKVKGNHQQS